MTDKTTSNAIRVLLVDDEEDLVTFLTHRLKKHGFAVAATNSGTEAVAAVGRQRFDVAVVDLKMPGMDGIECLERIKEVQPFLEVIMLTGHGSHESALEAGKLDAYRYLLKPYEFEELLAQIREAHAFKTRRMEACYLEESRKLSEEESSPRDLLRKQEALRKKYERD